MLTFAHLSSVKFRACLLAFALAFCALPSHANEAATKAEATQIDWDSAPKYIQEQIRNVVLNCTEGTLTPDKARIFEYVAPGSLPNYVYDYSAWEQHPINTNCQNSPPLCNQTGCLMSVYTQIKPGVFKQSLRTYVLKVAPKDIGERAPDGGVTVTAGFEMIQSKFACRILNGGTAPCSLNFTWKNNKFTYFGFGAKDDQGALEPRHEKQQPPKSDDE